jgi:hypothetical protein
MSNQERNRLIGMIDKLAATMERTNEALTSVGIELRGFRRDLEELRREHDERLRKLEGKRK